MPLSLPSRTSPPVRSARAHAAAFDGIWLPMITPMRQGRVDLLAAQSLARYYRDAGLAGLVLFGSTGEGNLLSLPEKVEMVEAIRADPHALPLVFGAGGVDTRGVAAMMRRLDKLEPVAWLIPAPYYLCPSQAGLLWHYRQLAWATRKPVILYNVPRRTGSALTVESVEALAQLPEITAIKECDPTALAVLQGRRPLPVLCGEDLSLLDHLLAGGRGAIPACAHVLPERYVALFELVRTGAIAQARECFEALRPLIRLLYNEPNPVGIKKALALQGLVCDELRAPLMTGSAELAERLRRTLQGLQREPRLRPAA
ncbi:dihydrodipicolinate synthase family protein [Pseudomonadota bacterium AL_CKDN230030165-1A_HGKHYDSX7]